MRHHATSKGNIPFTPEEELERDAEEAQFALDEIARIAEEANSVTVVEMLEAIRDKLAGTDTVKFDNIKNKKIKNG